MTNGMRSTIMNSTKSKKENEKVEACKKLPKTHAGRQLAQIELERSRVLSRLIKTVSAVMTVVMVLCGCLILPLEALLEMEDVFVHLVVLMLGMMSVSLIHELLRGLLMRIFSGVKPVVRYVGSYPHAACEAYFGRRAQQIINLVPPMVLVVMLLVLLITATEPSWKWMAWLVLTVAVCSCVRDGYVAFRLSQMPEDILVMNVGPTYLVYSASADKQTNDK